MISKVLEKLVNNRIVDHLEKCGLFSDFQYGFMFSRSTADLLTVVSARIDRAFNRRGATRAVALNPRLSTGFGVLVFFTNLNVMEFQVRYLALFFLFSVIDGFRWFWMGSLHKNIQLMLEFFKSPTLFLLYINDLPDNVICNIAIYADDTIYSKCDQASGNIWNWLLNLNLIYEKLWTWAGMDFLISMLKKRNWFRLTGLITLVLLMQKRMGLIFLDACVDFLLNWIEALT